MSDYEGYGGLPLFEQRADKTRQRVQLTETDRHRLQGRQRALLAATADRIWHNADFMIRHGGHRFSAAIFELREKGHRFEKRSTGDGGYQYRYLGWQPVHEITPKWRAAYFNSMHWQAKREARLRFDRGCCVFCHRGEGVHLVVHHWRVDLFNERIQDLATLCSDCLEQVRRTDFIEPFPKRVDAQTFNRLRGTQP